MKYPKINTLWKRNMENKALIIPGDYSCDEFKCIKYWEVTEKIDGTNIRIYWNGENKVEFKGRTDKANIEQQGNLLDYLQKAFTVDTLHSIFGDKEIVLYGEGFDPKVNTWCKTINDTGFVLFDIYAAYGKWYSREAVNSIATELNIDSVQVLGIWTEQEIINYIKSEPETIFLKDNYNMHQISEGVVCRTYPNMLFSKGNPVMMKLKVTDYKKLKKQI